MFDSSSLPTASCSVETVLVPEIKPVRVFATFLLFCATLLLRFLVFGRFGLRVWNDREDSLAFGDLLGSGHPLKYGPGLLSGVRLMPLVLFDCQFALFLLILPSALEDFPHFIKHAKILIERLQKLHQLPLLFIPDRGQVSGGVEIQLDLR